MEELEQLSEVLSLLNSETDEKHVASKEECNSTPRDITPRRWNAGWISSWPHWRRGQGAQEGREEHVQGRHKRKDANNHIPMDVRVDRCSHLLDRCQQSYSSEVEGAAKYLWERCQQSYSH